MESQIEIFESRVVSEEEYVFWHQALNGRRDTSQYDLLKVPQEVKQLIVRVGRVYDELWVESNWETGNDPALFGKKNGQLYLLARWGTDEAPLRTEKQLMTAYRRKVEREAMNDKNNFNAVFYVFEAILVVAIFGGLLNSKFLVAGISFCAVLTLEFFRRLHKNKAVAPYNIWTRKALRFVTHRL